MIPTKSSAVFFPILILLIGLWACEPTTKPGNDSSTIAPDASSDTPTTRSDTTESKTPTTPNVLKDCSVPGKRLEDNDFQVPNSTLLVSILSDSTTTDPEFGESHRIFQVYDLADCTIKYRETLPINFSPDYPYYLSPESYTEEQQLICTPGYNLLYCFDLKKMKPLPKMKATDNVESGVDAQSGMPVGVIGKENFLFGYAINMGGYVFDVTDKSKPKEIEPAATYISPDEEVNTLFFLPENAGDYQAVMTIIDDEGLLQAKNVFSGPIKVNPTLPANIRNNRFLVFKDQKTSEQMAIDMEKQAAVDLPDEMRTKSVQEILKWLKSR